MAAPATRCALCLQERVLCNSHVIPEFCYSRSYDHKHRARLFRTEHLKERFLQKGLREYLLCGECESRISVYEKYFKETWFDGQALPDSLTSKYLTIENLDYSKFKLFHLSILWRIGVSRSKWFSSVRLGPYAAKLRKLLLYGDPGPGDRYPFFGQVVLDEKRQVIHDFVSGPYKSKLDSFTVYYLCYAGCEWSFIVTDHDFGKYRGWSIQENGSLFLVAKSIHKLNTLNLFQEQRSGIQE